MRPILSSKQTKSLLSVRSKKSVVGTTNDETKATKKLKRTKTPEKKREGETSSVISKSSAFIRSKLPQRRSKSVAGDASVYSSKSTKSTKSSKSNKSKKGKGNVEESREDWSPPSMILCCGY